MPGRAYLQKFLARAVRAKCDCALIEVTSQGVVQHRHRFVHWDIGALTNLAPEHIESHGSFENYRAAKLAFLQYVIKMGGKVFLNRDDKHFGFFLDALRGDAMATSKDDGSIKKYIPSGQAGQKKNENNGETFGPSSFLWSDFNAQNVAVAIAIAKQLKVSDEAIQRALAGFKSVQGRAEFVERDGCTAVVDYAHTPDSLEAIYKAVKPKREGSRLICVLGGTGGGRDRWKRPAMGAVAAKYCDEIILTDEDPYDEDPLEIMREIEVGVLGASPQRKNMTKILDRREAIRTAVNLMKKGDVVIGTGKGSEDWIHGARGSKLPWNERAEFEKALGEKNKT